MNNKVVNLTLLNVIKQLNNFIVKHPSKAYQSDLSNSEFRQNLIDYVLLRIPNRYNSNDEEKASASATAKILEQEKFQIEKLIYQGYYHLRKKEIYKDLFTDENYSVANLFK